MCDCTEKIGREFRQLAVIIHKWMVEVHTTSGFWLQIWRLKIELVLELSLSQCSFSLEVGTLWICIGCFAYKIDRKSVFEFEYFGSLRARLILAKKCLTHFCTWVWSSMNWYEMFIVQTSTLPPSMYRKFTKHVRFCMRNNQLSPKSYVELEGNFIWDNLPCMFISRVPSFVIIRGLPSQRPKGIDWVCVACYLQGSWHSSSNMIASVSIYNQKLCTHS